MKPGDLTPDNGHEPETEAIATRLHAERPIPHPGFRGELRRRLVAAGTRPTAPARLRLVITGYAASGLGLLGVAAIGLVGAGPFAS